MAMRPQIILLGDSITEQSFGPFGWGAALADQYKGKSEKVGFVAVRCGGTRIHWLQYTVDLIPSGQDLPHCNSSAQTPPLVRVLQSFATTSSSNLPERRILLRRSKSFRTWLLAQSDSTLIILITPPPVSEKGLLACSPHLLDDTSGQPTHVNQFTGMYAQECVSVAREADVQCLNLWSIFQETPRWEALLSDGIHLSVEGNQVVFEELVKLLDESDFVPSTLKIDTLKLDEVPYDSPEEMEDGYESPDSSFQTWSAPKVKEYASF
ncbi:hypothetical protein AXG93_2381s1030 [Marchantia polymorpha subsp. ruderalis]|uniref:Uncharacterized protein n=1 Tax=Marchantia polymorpha subsp. ruderalis TaxID=1480154 RepID=A0A176VP25_MARPO|nr:hypothetical protein AXG93_2381s1030 [Marchantia polymorpha subsp. ruderalis]